MLVRILHIQIDLRHIVQNTVFDTGENQLRKQYERRRTQAAFVKPAAERQTDNRGSPQARSGGQSGYTLPPRHNDRAGADKTDTSYDLRTQTCHVSVIMHVQEQVLAGHCCHTCTHTNQDMGTKARRTPFICPLQADDAAAEHSKQQADSNGGQRHIAQAVENRKHDESSLY